MRATRHWRPAALAAALLTATIAVAPAVAHEGNPKYRSEVRTVTPAVEGVTVRVLDHDDSLELTNRSGRAVVVYGYEDEPFVRILGDETVQVNERSATVKANGGEEDDDHAHDEEPAAGAAAGYELVSYEYAHAGEEHPADEHRSTSEAREDHSTDETAVHWVTLDKTGRFSWHDDRIKWRKTAVPPQVTDESQETKVLDWNVPIRVGTQAGAIDGTLFWIGEPGASGGFPVAAAVSLAAVALLAALAVLFVRRRRSGSGPSSGASGA